MRPLPLTPVALMLLCVTPLGANAQDQAFAKPVFAQKVQLTIPNEFALGYEAEQDGLSLTELVPQGQTVDAWGQMITMTGRQGMAAQMGLIDEANRLAGNYQGACPDSFVSQPLPAPKIAGAAGSFAAYLGCGDVGGQSEAMVFVVIGGTSDVYTVQWAQRGLGLEATMQPDMALWNDRLRALAATRLCAPTKGEVAPYSPCGE